MPAPPPYWRLRHSLKQSIRCFFAGLQYLEVDTPVLVRMPGTEIHLEYFASTWTDHQLQQHALYLRSSPELHMKRVLAAGEPRVFQFAPCFRNHGELGAWHNPEFTMLEWYQTGIGFTEFMTQTEELLRVSLADMRQAFGDLVKLQLPASIPRLSVSEAFAKFTGITLVDGDPALAAKGKQAGSPSVNLSDDFETAFFKLLLERVEPELAKLQAVFLYDYPPSMAALAKVEGGWAKRFELYIHGVELCNAFAELLSAADNRQRMEDANRRRAALGKAAMGIDEDFLKDLHKGLPPSCGNALGLERWLTLVVGADNLQALMPFSEYAHRLP